MWSDFQKTTLNFSGLAVVGSYDYIQVSAACPPSPAVLLNLTNPTTEGQLTGLTEGCKHTLSATAYCGTSAGTVQTATTKEQCTRKCMLASIVAELLINLDSLTPQLLMIEYQPTFLNADKWKIITRTSV